MLVITDEARDAIRGIIEDERRRPERRPADLRPTRNGELRSSSSSRRRPGEGDEVVREGGAVVFLDPTAAELLADKILDAHAHGDHVHFSLEEQTYDERLG